MINGHLAPIPSGDLLPFMFVFGSEPPFAERIQRYADVCFSEERRALVGQALTKALMVPRDAQFAETVRP